MTAEARQPAGAESAGELESLSAPAGTAGDSIAVATWTIVSRATGVARFAAIGAVLGPTFFGNTYQFTNSLANLVYYGFLAGSLVASLLVPALVRHIDAGDSQASERVAGGFLGVSLIALLFVAPFAVLVAPYALRLAVLGGSSAVGAAQQHVGQLLILMFIPQVFFYCVVGTATAVMNAHRRFALPAAAPAVENIAVVAVLVATALIYRTKTEVQSVPAGEMLLLGIGTSGAVALHAAVQWWGARRAGVKLLPRRGWRDPEVRAVVRRTVASIAQAGLYALQLLFLLIMANALAGGVVAFQIGLNFFNLAIAIGAQPVALSLLPRLARFYEAGQEDLFHDTLARGYSLGVFVAMPVAVGYLVLARPLAEVISFGRMGSSVGVSMVALSIAALSLAVVAQTVYSTSSYAWYARKNAKPPMISMGVQTVVCLGLLALARQAHGTTTLTLIGLSFSMGIVASAAMLTNSLRRRLSAGSERITPSLVRVTAGSALMAGPAWVVAWALSGWIGGRMGPAIGIAAAVLVGGGVFVGLQVLWKTRELGWILTGLGLARGRTRRTVAGVSRS